ncbi:MAG: bifunctional riboflavin kinase/FAD synthetase [Bacteroidetes bacterium]|nr:bifunctional riboflavin kinase/FAD synthetase [Bacteroidota bacterium]
MSHSSPVIFHGLDGFPFSPNHYLTLGAFDGLHLGHRQIVDQVVTAARSNHGESVLITFDPHPQEVIQKGPDPFFLLSTLPEKIQVLKHTGLDKILVLPFTRDFSELPPEAFIKNILVGRVGMRKIWIGYDHGFGRDRSGGIDLLKQLGPECGFTVEQVGAHEVGSVVVSSTKIREAIRHGQVELATEMLGYPYTVSGIVSRGEGIGRKIGFPTANIFVEHPRKLIPHGGVYHVELLIGTDWHRGVCNIGQRPTFDGQELRIEVHLLQFQSDIYGMPVCLRFHRRLREEKKFPSVDELIRQITKDVEEANIFWNGSGW